MKHSQGMSLLEILIALGVFVFMFTFISQVVKQNYRHAKKLKQGIQVTSSLSGVLSLMRQDFNGVAYLLDINENLDIRFPLEQKDYSSQSDDQPNPNKNPKTSNQIEESRSSLPMLLSPYFSFRGEAKEVKFVSYTLSQSDTAAPAQWIKIRYFLENCSHWESGGSGLCLIRSASRYWELENEDEGPEETLILLRNLEGLRFSYANREDLMNDKWREKWRLEGGLSLENSPVTYSQKIPFPSMIKIEMKKGNSTQVFLFPVSSSYLKTWNPYDKNYPGFSKWEPPKDKSKDKPKGEPEITIIGGGTEGGPRGEKGKP